MPVLILAGDEDFELSRRVQALRDKLLDPAWASFNLVRLDNPNVQQVVDAAAQLPFGPGNKVILIERCDLFTKKRGKGGSDDDASAAKSAKKETAKDKTAGLEQFEAALEAVAPNTFLLFSCPYNFDSTLKTSKAVPKSVGIERFEKERYFVGSKNPKLETWCRKEAKRFGATIDDAAVTYLLDGLEADLRSISNELEKASVFILPKTHITLDIVQTLTPFHSHVFVLADKWISGRTTEAYDSLRELLSRQSGMPIIAMLQTMLSKWVHMKMLCEKYNLEAPHGTAGKRELPMSELVKRVSAQVKSHPVVVENDLKRISKETSASLIRKKVELTRMEHLVKTGQLPEGHALELLIAS
ncbi:MAG TPA: DNA polymerase III subunit delta [Oculatellaceae cyanobacterium]